MNREKEDFRRVFPFDKEAIGNDILCPVAVMDINKGAQEKFHEVVEEIKALMND